MKRNGKFRHMNRPLIILLSCLAAAGILQVLLATKSGFARPHVAGPIPLLRVSEVGMDRRPQRFALYQDGTVICLSNKADSKDACITYKVADAKELADSLLSFDISNTRNEYNISDATCQPSTAIWTPHKTIDVYGNWRKAPVNHNEDDDMRYRRDLQLWDSLPVDIRMALVRVDEQCQMNGTPWFPEKIEVKLYSARDATETAIPWPRGWPTLKAKDTRMYRSDWEPGEYRYLVYLPSSLLPELHKFLPTQDASAIVSISGERMVATYRFPFPGEDAWMTREGLAPMEKNCLRIQKRDLAAIFTIIVLLCLTPLAAAKSSCGS